MTAGLTVRQESLRVLSANVDLPAVAGITRYYFGVVDEAGFQWHRLWIISGQGLPYSASAYWVFRPIAAVIGTDGAYTLKYLGSPRGTNTHGVNVNVPYKCHKEDALNFDIPSGSALGVEITTVSTPASKRATFSATVTYGG